MAVASASTAALMNKLNIVTMRWGTRYTSAHVNRLYHQLQRNGMADSTFHCFTDDPAGLEPALVAHPLPEIDLPEAYRWTNRRKLSLFRADLAVTGPCLYFDVDSVVLGPLNPLLEDWSGKPRLMRSFTRTEPPPGVRHDGINSSLMLFEAGSCPQVMQRFEAEKQRFLADWPGDQGFVHDTLKDACEYFPQGYCVSFKKQCIPHFPLNLVLPPRPPQGARAVFFHGRPDPDEARVGFRTGPMKRRCRPARWIEPPAPISG